MNAGELGVCPHCLRLVQLPASVAMHERLRCPYCSAQHLAEAVKSGAPRFMSRVDPPSGNMASITAATWPDGLSVSQVDAPDLSAWSALGAHITNGGMPAVNPSSSLATAPSLGPRIPLDLGAGRSRGMPIKGNLWQVLAPIVAAPLGLAIGYGLVLWLFGPDRDFLQVLPWLNRITSTTSDVSTERPKPWKRMETAPAEGPTNDSMADTGGEFETVRDDSWITGAEKPTDVEEGGSKQLATEAALQQKGGEAAAGQDSSANEADVSNGNASPSERASKNETTRKQTVTNRRLNSASPTGQQKAEAGTVEDEKETAPSLRQSDDSQSKRVPEPQPRRTGPAAPISSTPISSIPGPTAPG